MQKEPTRTAASALLGLLGGLLVSCAPAAQPVVLQAALPQTQTTGELEQVATFTGQMPTGVTVSQEGRVFVNFPRWGDEVAYTVAEIVNGEPVAYPNAEITALNLGNAADTFVSVQSVVIDPADRLWVLDTGSVNFAPVVPGGPKLVGIDLKTNEIFQTVRFPENVVLPTTYLNDIRFDLTRGEGGVAYITDSSDTGPNGLIVVDLASGESRRLLSNHPSTVAQPGFLPLVEGRPLMQRVPNEPPAYLTLGSDGIAISADGSRLYYCPLASRRLYSVSTEALRDETLTPAEVAATIRDEGMKPASDGLESDAEGRVYATAYEQNAIVRLKADGFYETIVADPRLLWPDTIALAADGYLYVNANQLQRQASYHNGKDLREKPYSMFRIKVDATPVTLR